MFEKSIAKVSKTSDRDGLRELKQFWRKLNKFVPERFEPNCVKYLSIKNFIQSKEKYSFRDPKYNSKPSTDHNGNAT
jgi:hypothetical protein